MKENKVQFIAVTAMAVALTYVFTAFVNVRLPIAANGGLIHLGNVPLFIMAILFGKKTGAIAGGVGMGLFDLLSGWTAWAPFTFIIVGIMGYVVGAITEKHDQYGWKVAAIFAAFVIKIVGIISQRSSFMETLLHRSLLYQEMSYRLQLQLLLS